MTTRAKTDRVLKLLWVTVTLTAALPLLACGPRRAVGAAADAVSGPWEHGSVDLPDRTAEGPLRMHYLVSGPVDGPRVVLLHGFPDLSYGWRGVLPDLARDHRVFAPDLRGFGATGRPEEGYGVHDLASDIAAFIAAAAEVDGLPAETPAHLVGHDWGAMTGWWVAIDHPASLLTYTAISVPHPLAWTRFLAEDAEQRRRAVYQTQLAAPGVDAVLGGLSRRALEKLYRADLVHPEAVTDEDMDVYERAYGTKDGWVHPLRYYQHLEDDAEQNAADLEAAAPLSMPVLVLWGAKDGFVYSRQAERSCEHVSPGPCEVEIFDDAAHFVLWEVPGAVATRWRAFVAGT